MSTSPQSEPNLSPTALYTAEVWKTGGFEHAEWMGSKESKTVYRVVSVFLWIQRLFRKNFPRLREGLLQRHAALDALAIAWEPDEVIEVAAGLSSRASRLLNTPTCTRYVEIDLPEMTRAKEERLAQSPGKALLENPRFEQVSGDIRKVATLCSASVGQRTCVIAEGIFMYLSPAEQREVIEGVASILGGAQSGLFLFDFVPPAEEPSPGLFGRFMGWCMALLTGGGAFDRSPQKREDLVNKLQETGFHSVLATDAHKLNLPAQFGFPGVPTRQVIYQAELGPLASLPTPDPAHA